MLQPPKHIKTKPCVFHAIYMYYACLLISLHVPTESYDICVPMVNQWPSAKMSTMGNYNVAAFSNALFIDCSAKHHTEFCHPTEWLDALRTDDVETATAILHQASAEYKDFLMNGDIPTSNSNHQNQSQPHPSHKCSSMEFSITKPLHAATVFHSHAVLRLLFTSGANIQQVDCWKNNVVHVLIYAHSTEPVRETKYDETLAYLQDLLSENDMRSLLAAENEFALRPLEFAALRGCTGLATIIMQTKGVYLIKEESIGYNVVQYLDVSDYELFDDGLPTRFFTSPLLLFVMNDTSQIPVTESGVVHRNSGFQSWARAKMMMNWPFVCIWFLFRMFYIALFISASTENSWPTVVNNGSYPNTNNTEEIAVCSCQASDRGSYRWGTLALVSLLIVMYDLYSYVRIRRIHHPALFKLVKIRDRHASVQFYRSMQLATCLSVVAICVGQILRFIGLAVPLVFDHILYLIVSYGCVWGVLYFLQVLPWISIYAFAVQRMLQVLIRFMVIFFLFLFAFAISFRRTLLDKSHGCPIHFDTLGETVYSTFLVILNLVNFRVYESGNTHALYMLHIFFVFFMSVMLINFLIAIMTQSFANVFENRCVIIQTQRLALILTIQCRLAWPMQALYKILQRKAFVFHNKRLCVCRTVIKGRG